MKIRSRNGFTLIELLVVIAIIGIISSITLTSLSSAKAKARDARRLADLHTLELAIQFYYESNEKFPINNSTGWSGDWTDTYKAQLAPYLPNPPVDPLENNSGRYYASYRMTWAPDPKCNGHYVLWAFLEKSGPNNNTCGFISAPYFVVMDRF